MLHDGPLLYDLRLLWLFKIGLVRIELLLLLYDWLASLYDWLSIILLISIERLLLLLLVHLRCGQTGRLWACRLALLLLLLIITWLSSGFTCFEIQDLRLID